MGHPKPENPTQTDNSNGNDIANETIQKKISKSIDMGLYWIKDHVPQGQFHVLWRPDRQS